MVMYSFLECQLLIQNTPYNHNNHNKKKQRLINRIVCNSSNTKHQVEMGFKIWFNIKESIMRSVADKQENHGPATDALFPPLYLNFQISLHRGNSMRKPSLIPWMVKLWLSPTEIVRRDASWPIHGTKTAPYDRESPMGTVLGRGAVFGSGLPPPAMLLVSGDTCLPQ